MADRSLILQRRYSKRLFTTTNKTSNSTIPVSMIKSTNNIGILRQMLESTIKFANNKLRNLNKKAKEQKAKEEDAALKIQKAVRHMIDKKIGKSILDKLREERKILKQERLEKIDIVQNALNELLIIQKNITEGIIKESDGIINRIKDIFGIVDSSSREINTSRGRSSRENSSKINTSRGRSSRENSSRVIRTIGRISGENSSRVIRSRENSSKTYSVIDKSELMMNNLKTILKFLSTIWSDYIIYDDENNTGSVKLIIKLPGASYDISYNNITELANNFKKYYNTILIACYFPCSKDIKELISKLNKSNDDEKSYDIIIELLKQYIKENIKKPEQTVNLNNLQKEIEGLEKIRGGKLRKVRKTNVSKKITTRVIRNRKL